VFFEKILKNNDTNDKAILASKQQAKIKLLFA